MVAAAEDAQTRHAARVIAVILVVATALLLVSDVLFDFVRYRHGSFLADSSTFVTVAPTRPRRSAWPRSPTCWAAIWR